MKRIFFLMLLCVTLLLTGCTQQAKPGMYIEPAKLTAEEEQIKAMASQGRFVHFFDFQLDQTVQTISVQVYRLEDAQWVPYSVGGKMAMPENRGKGRLALDFYQLYEGVGISVQGSDDNRYSFTTSRPDSASFDPSGMALYTTALSMQQELAYNVELPIALQIHTAKNAVTSMATDFFHQPERIAAEGHDHVYAVTVTFSNEPME